MSSLELFAKTRGLSYEQHITSFDAGFQPFLNSKGNALTDTDVQNVTVATFGIEAEHLRQIHTIDRQARTPYLWILPTDPQGPATRKRITHPNSEQLKCENKPNFQAVVEITNQYQQDIEECILLPHYKWPKMAQWPKEDHRHAGYESNECQECETFRGIISRKRKPNDSRFKRCKCTLADWMWKDTKGNEWPCCKRPLIDLFDAGRVSTGVRALEPIESLQILDPYVSEMYTAHKKDRSIVVSPRYGDAEGKMYRAGIPIEKRRAKTGSSGRRA